ncbi:PAS domain-containing protein [Sandaracinus amylolyticus]|uniref:histidine kinase n=1 Tax=Sandaracinus amylolyticus TaxID=927083 RepID=A0A0F6YJX9_9BACT|nr:PAS domain-containing protein [Sandaracinus amylolyticus]AKF08626.1 Two-component hybrid sensor and regulator [Sandaracinus amylolyticus]
MIDAVPTLVAYVDADERYRFVNRAYETFLGCSRAEVLGQSVREVLGDAAYAALDHLVRAALSGRIVSYQAEIPFRRAGKRWVDVVYTPDVDASGRVLGFVALAQDVAERKAQEAAHAAMLERERSLVAQLESSNARMHDLLAQLPAIVSVTRGPEHRYELVSPTGAAVFGRFAQAGCTVQDALDALGARSSDAIARYDHVFRTGDTVVQRIRYVIPGEHGARSDERTFDVRLQPRRAPDGSIEGVISFAVDITEKERADARQALLVEWSRMLSGTLDVTTALERLAALIVPQLGDDVVVRVLGEDGTIRQVAERSTIPEREAALRAMRDKGALAGGPSPTARTIETGETVFLPVIDDALLERIARDEEHLALLRGLAARSAISVPLVAQGEVLGAIGIGLTASPRDYEPADVALAEELGRRAGAAVAHARDQQALRAARERDRFLAEATRLLAESLDPSETIERTTALAVPLLADVCTVRELDDAPETSSDAELVLPLARAGRALGSLRLAMSSSGRRFEPWHRELAGELAARAAVALDHAQLYRATRESAARAQRALGTLDAVVRASPLAVMLLDLDGCVRMWNRSAERIFGWSEDEVLGRVLPAIDPHELEAFREQLCRVAAGATLREHEMRARRRDGSFDALVWAAPVEGASAAQVLVKVADVGDRKRIDAALASSARRLSVIAEVSRTFAEAGLDPELATRAIARIVAEQLGDGAILCLVTPDGTSLEIVAEHHVDPQHHALAFAAFAKVFPIDGSLAGSVVRSGEPLRLDTRERAGERALSDAGRRYVERVGTNDILIVPLRLRGVVLGTLGVSRERPRPYDPDDLALLEEIADRAAYVIENARLYRTAQDATRLRDEFLATVSHELRTPLNALVGWTQLARDKATDAPFLGRALTTIHRNAMLQAKLVDDLLDVSRMITGKLRLERRRIRAEEPVRAAIDVLAAAADARRIALQVIVADDAGDVVGDAARLQQVTWNLVSNAVKFAPERSTVEVSLTREQGELVLRVRDEGIGFEPSFAPHLFERFRQAHATPGTGKGGLGLGLSIVRHLVELHGGRVRASSDGLGRGALFEVRIPTGGAPEKTVDDVEALPPSEPPPPLRSDARLDGIRVLVAEDDADAREALRASLVDRGASVIVAEDGRVALELFDVEMPDVVISDIAMPHLDGYALLRALRQRTDRASSIPAVAVTAFARPEDEWRARDAGFSRHVAKPIDGATLVAIVSELCGRSG